MFLDELEQIDRAMHSPAILDKSRRRAYFEFRDSSEPWERAVPLRPRRSPRLAIAPTDADGDWACDVCGRKFPSREVRREHLATHRPRACKARDGVPATQHRPTFAAPAVQLRYTPAPGDFVMWVCRDCGRVIYMWADSGCPEDCPDCHGCKWTPRRWTGRAA